MPGRSTTAVNSTDWGAIAVMDFFKVEVMTLIGPVRYPVLVVMDLKTHLIMDRDPVFTAGVRDMLRDAGAKPVSLPRCRWPVGPAGATR